jgi:hypothetical protein
MRRDLHNRIETVLLMEPVDLAHTETPSRLLDTKGFDRAELSVIVGALTGVDGNNTVIFKAQESNTTVGTDFTDVAAADLIGAFTLVNSTSKDSVLQRVGYKGSKRYVRLIPDYTGTGITVGIIVVIGILAGGGDIPPDSVAAVSAT